MIVQRLSYDGTKIVHKLLSDNGLRRTENVRILYKMSGKQPKNLSAADFKDIADRIAAVAESYRRVAETMQARNIAELSVIGVDTLEAVTLARINGPLQSAERALLTTKAKPSADRKAVYKVAEDPAKLELKKQAAKANQAAADRKNKKGK